MWQTLETKARFIQQVMTAQTSVRSAEDIEGGALTYAEIKAIASGNPAVMEKVKVDTEIRKLDQLRAVHVNQQHSIRWSIRNLPQQIVEAHHNIDLVQADIARRDANAGEFSMTVGKRFFSGKGAREEAAKALNAVVLSWRDDPALEVRAQFRGFEILSRGKPATCLLSEQQSVPDLFVRGVATWTAHFNADNPIGTIQSIENTLRGLDKTAEADRAEVARLEKALVEFQAQADRPFEYEERMQELCARQSQLNALLDLDKGEQQIGEAAESDPDGEHQPPRPDMTATTARARALSAALRRNLGP
jgi:hypothetical protein